MVLITLEGIDGSGKSTLHSALQELLRDLDPVFTREPGATWVGDAVRRAIAEQIDPVTEATLFVADHAAHLVRVIRPALESGKLVISDRYSDSRFAYQSVTLEGVVPRPEEWLRAMHNSWTITPDKTFLCVLPVDDALTRLKPVSEREHFEKREILDKVQNKYLEFARNEPSRFVIVDAMKEKEEIAQFVAGAIRLVGEKAPEAVILGFLFLFNPIPTLRLYFSLIQSCDKTHPLMGVAATPSGRDWDNYLHCWSRVIEPPLGRTRKGAAALIITMKLSDTDWNPQHRIL
jgi:dTMP kinase